MATPQPEVYWTPAYWGYDSGAYGFHAGYWGPHVGFYGGINYGYGYDGYGNRVSKKKGNAAADVLAHNAANNRIAADDVQYDENGNIIKLQDMNLSFDIDNRLVAIDRQGQGTEQYGYNPGNLRIWKKLATGEEEVYMYGNGGRKLATYKLAIDENGNGDATLSDYDMYFGEKLIRSNSKPVVLDRLGHVHAWIDSHNSVQKTSYLPFGEEVTATKHNRRKFGTYVRDDFSELDYAQQRYYSSALGRSSFSLPCCCFS